MTSRENDKSPIYKCPFEDKHYEILRKFPCNTDSQFGNDTTGQSIMLLFRLLITCKEMIYSSPQFQL